MTTYLKGWLHRSCVGAFLLAVAGTANAQVAPIGAHYAARTSDSGFGAGVSAGGDLTLSVPLELPPPRGELPLPVAVVHTGGSQVAEAGVGWAIPFSFVRRPTGLTYHRPRSHPLGDWHTTRASPREQLFLSLGGAPMLMTRVGEGRYRPVVDSQELLLTRRAGDAWLAEDGSGRRFLFERIADLKDDSMWLLTRITDRTRRNFVVLEYRTDAVSVPGGAELRELFLDTVRYDFHDELLAPGCAKHEVILHYDRPFGESEILGYSVQSSSIRVRTKILKRIEVLAVDGAPCNSPTLRLLHQYEFGYERDQDTRRPRLTTVDLRGRRGTPEGGRSLPVARYRYGAATMVTEADDDQGLLLQYVEAGAIPLSDELGSAGGALASMEPGPAHLGFFPSVEAGYRTRHVTQDFTGDGRPDLLFPKDDTIWIARNVATGSGPAYAAPKPAGPIFDGKALPLAEQNTFKPIYKYDPKLPGAEITWVQAIDVNGDGRLDIIDARESPDFWVVYLNSPGDPPTEIVWLKKTVNIRPIRRLLRERGFFSLDEGRPFPLARSWSGNEIIEPHCFEHKSGDPVDVWTTYPCALLQAESKMTASSARSIVEWKLADINGDGYPDFLANSSPVSRVRSPEGCTLDENGTVVPPPARHRFQHQQVVCRVKDALDLTGRANNRVDVFYNWAGVRIPGTGGSPESATPLFLAPRSLGTFPCGLERWALQNEARTMVCGFEEVSGDGLLDRIDSSEIAPFVTRARLGTGEGFPDVAIRLPGSPVRIRSDREFTCRDAEDPDYDPDAIVNRTTALLDVTGDGIPDYVVENSSRRFDVHIGTGTGFLAPIPIESSSFGLSTTVEPCEEGPSETFRTTRGLVDIDGDGRLDYLRIVDGEIIAHRLRGGAGQIGAHDAGRLVRVENGYGAATVVTYGSAKEDTRSLHQVPRPEIVVTRIETVEAVDKDSLGPGPERLIAPVLYAYGDASLRFSPLLDRWVFPGYGRQVMLNGVPPAQSASIGLNVPRMQGTATILDRIRPGEFEGPTAEINSEAWKDALYRKHVLVGRIQDVHILDGILSEDPWTLVNLDVSSDPRWHANRHIDYAVRRIEGQTPSGASALFDCNDLSNPYSFPDFSGDYSVFFRLCAQTGFVFPEAVTAWRGEAPPPSDKNLETRVRVLDIDDVGRPLLVHYENDTARSDDDICEERAYANGVGPIRVLDALHYQRLRDCEKGSLVFAGVRYRYDFLPEGQASRGLPSHRIVERYDAFDGVKLDEALQDLTAYDVYGNIAGIHLSRQDPDTLATVTQSTTFRYDPFALVAIEQLREASDSSTELRAVVDEIDAATLLPLATTDANGTTWKTYYDGFHRPVLNSTISPTEQRERVLAEISYLGDDGMSPKGRRIRVRAFHTDVDLKDYRNDPSAAAAKATEAVIHLDALGRRRFIERKLGPDYDDAVVVTDFMLYDPLGRPQFAADPFLPGQPVETRYGTTFHYRPDGTLRCVVEGKGIQALSQEADPAEDRYPTCFEYVYEGHQIRARTRTPNSLLAGTPETDVYHETVATAVGWIVESSRWRAGQRLELAEHGYDRLGQLNWLARYADPHARSGPVYWRFRNDSLGQLLKLAEPATEPRLNTYDAWGSLLEQRWTETVEGFSFIRGIRMRYDGFGRLIRSVELENGDEQPDTEAQFFYDDRADDPNHVAADFLLGRLARTLSPARKSFFGYDELGRVRTESRVGTDGVRHTVQYNRNIDDSLRELIFLLPDTDHAPETVHYEYDSARRISGVRWSDEHGSAALFTALDIDPLGRYRRFVLGNGIHQTQDFRDDGRREFQRLEIAGAGGRRQIEVLGYDANMRVKSRVERVFAGGSATPTAAWHRDDTYDAMGRLIRSRTQDLNGELKLDEGFAYDGLGNLLQVNNHLGSFDIEVTLDPVDRDRICSVKYGKWLPEPPGDSGDFVLAAPALGSSAVPLPAAPALSDLSSDPAAIAPEDRERALLDRKVQPAPPAPSCDYRYDALGNVTEQKGYFMLGVPPWTRQLAYDAHGRVITIAEGPVKASFAYDATGQVAELKITGAEGVTIRESRHYGPLVEEASLGLEGTSLIERRIPGPLGVLLSRRGTGSDASVLYWHGDGTANRYFTDKGGSFVQEASYRPFGALSSQSVEPEPQERVDYLWNGGLRLPEIGLVQLGARVYDPGLGRFLQRDPLLVVRTASTIHPYAFAFNDPSNFRDPSGLDPQCDNLTPECPGEGFDLPAGGLDMACLLVGCSPDDSRELWGWPLPPFVQTGAERVADQAGGRAAPLGSLFGALTGMLSFLQGVNDDAAELMLLGALSTVSGGSGVLAKIWSTPGLFYAGGYNLPPTDMTLTYTAKGVAESAEGNAYARSMGRFALVGSAATWIGVYSEMFIQYLAKPLAQAKQEAMLAQSKQAFALGMSARLLAYDWSVTKGELAHMKRSAGSGSSGIPAVVESAARAVQWPSLAHGYAYADRLDEQTRRALLYAIEGSLTDEDRYFFRAAGTRAFKITSLARPINRLLNR